MVLETIKGALVAATMMSTPCHVPEFGAFSEEYGFLIDASIEANWSVRYHPYRCMAYAQIVSESSGDPNAVSATGAQGLTQFQPTTFRELAQKHHLTCSPFDPKCSIEAYTLYTAWLIRYFSAPRPDSDRLGGWVVTAYHTGAGNPDRAQVKCGGATRFADMEPCLPQVISKVNAELNRRYVRRVSSLYQRMTGDVLFDLTPSKPPPEPPPEPSLECP